MEFSDKYDLLESLTSGAVETFIANDKRRNEKVLVHILHCEPQRPNQPTVQWVLEGFRKAAPEPAGVVMDTGKYSGTLYAYLVTSVPEATALQKWIQQYNLRRTGAHEVPAPAASPAAPPPKAAPAVDQNATAEMPVPDMARVPVQFTQIFREFGSNSITPPADIPKASEIPLRGVPSLDDPEHPSGLQAAPSWDTAASGRYSSPKLDSTPPAPAAKPPDPFFSSEFSVKSFSSETTPSAPKNNAKAGEFTSFFQGPFRPDVPSDVPPVSSIPSEPPQRSVGGFTEVFGAVSAQPEPIVPAESAKKSGSGTGFTGWFSDPDILTRGPESPASAAPPVSSVNDSASVFPSPSKPPLATPPAPPQPIASSPAPPSFPIPTPVIPKPPAMPSVPSSPEGATRAFSAPSIEPIPLQSTPQFSGPSPYTQVISMRPPVSMDGAETATQEKSAGGAGAGMKLPEIKPPQISAPPMAAPKITPPRIAAPKIAAPKLSAPKSEEAKPPVSYWPLVITLTILFCLAVLLVLYFVLKH